MSGKTVIITIITSYSTTNRSFRRVSLCVLDIEIYIHNETYNYRQSGTHTGVHIER